MDALFLVSFLTIIVLAPFIWIFQSLALTGSTFSLALCAFVVGHFWIRLFRVRKTLWNNLVAIGCETVVTCSLASGTSWGSLQEVVLVFGTTLLSPA